MGTIPSGSVIWGRANLGSRKNILYEFYRNYFCWIRNLWDGQLLAAIAILYRNFILIIHTGVVICGLGKPVPSSECFIRFVQEIFVADPFVWGWAN